MATKTRNTTQLNYGIYAVDKYGNTLRQVFDGTVPARYATIEQAQQALPRLQAIENAIMAVWGFSPDKLVVGGRTW